MTRERVNAGWEHRSWTSHDGLMLHARDYAAAPGAARLPVICLHGLTRNASDFDALAPWLAARQRRVLAVDVRGRGLSDRDPAADYRLPAYAMDVVALAAALGLARAIFIGTSMGGLITIETARRAPALIAAAIINDIGPVIAAAGLARIGGYVGTMPALRSWHEAADYLRLQNEHALPHYRASDWLAMAYRLFRETAEALIPDYDPAIARTFTPATTEAESWENWAMLAADRPLLVIRGERSDILDRGIAERMIGGRPLARLVEIGRVGHAPMLDEPEALAVLAEFLDGLPEEPSSSSAAPPGPKGAAR